MGTEKNKKDAYSTEKGNDNFPKYPHYNADEDITRAKNNNGKSELDETNISLPNSYDIPGQEHITPPSIGELADTTASSADEEDVLHGDSLDDERDEDVKIVMGTEADVTPEDIRMLEQADQNMDTKDDMNLLQSSLDDTDEDGELLNEEDSIGNDATGSDLDIPGSELDDREEKSGAEDEENNYYSLGGENHENLDEDNYTS